MRSAAANSHLASAATPAATPGVTPDSQPEGCTFGYYCTYNSGNGGTLCEQIDTNSNLRTGCRNENESGYNNTYGRTVHLRWGVITTVNSTFYALGAGDYLLYMTENYFNDCPGGGETCYGWGESMGYNVASVAGF